MTQREPSAGFVSAKQPVAPPKPAPRRHIWAALFCRKPQLCDHCGDFVWGLDQVGQFCRNCKYAYHSGCVSFAKGECLRERKSLSIDFETQPSPLNSWTVDNVLSWLCVIGTYRYVAVFRSLGIDGDKLANLSEDKLGEFGIAEKAQQRAIIVAISYLHQRVRIPRVTDRSTNLKSSNADAEHAFVERSFGYCETCEVCGLVLLGLTRQGLQCKLCGLRSHRSCAKAGAPECRYTVSLEAASARSLFEAELQEQFDPQSEPAPFILIVCCEEIEHRVEQRVDGDLKKALIDVYRKSPSNEDVRLLESAIVDLHAEATKNSSQWQASAEKAPRGALRRFEDAILFGGVVKKYLRYLPDSLIPVAYYPRLLETAADERQSTAVRLRQVNSMLADLPVHSKVTLRYMMQHLVRLAALHDQRNGSDLLKSYLPVFNQIIIRPPWHYIIDMINRETSFTMIVEALMRGCDWGIELPSSCRFKDIGSRPGGGEERLEDFDWYWGAVTRNMVADTMQEQPDGAFLVRDSISCSSDDPNAKEYTLTLRKGQKDTLIKIYCRNGKYGFAEATLFDSVPALINYHRTNSLSSYNPQLNITLNYPVSRKQFLVDHSELPNSELHERLKDLTALILRKEKEAQSLEEQIAGTAQQIETHQTTINAYTQVIQLLYEQNKAILTSMKQQVSATRDSTYIGRYAEAYDRRIQELTKDKNQPEMEVARLTNENNSLSKELARIKTELKRHGRKRDQITDVLLRRTEPAEIDNVIAELDRINDESEFQPRMSALTLTDSAEEMPSSSGTGDLTPTRSNSLSNPGPRSTYQQAAGLVPQDVSRKSSTPAPAFDQRVPRTPTHYQQPATGVASIPVPVSAHADRSNWFRECNRQEAERILARQPDGTFLVRPSKENEPGFRVYSLSIKYTDPAARAVGSDSPASASSNVKHCLIYEARDGSCGFKPNACVAASLVEFVCHYAVNSLRECNPELDVMLAYPAFARQPSEDDYDADANYTEMSFRR